MAQTSVKQGLYLGGGGIWQNRTNDADMRAQWRLWRSQYVRIPAVRIIHLEGVS
jgi:hypothetical protein